MVVLRESLIRRASTLCSPYVLSVYFSCDLRPCDQVYLIERHALVYSPQD